MDDKPKVVRCGNAECAFLFTLGAAVYRRRIKGSKDGRLYCCRTCSAIGTAVHRER